MLTLDRRHFLAAAPGAVLPAALPADTAKKKRPFREGINAPVAFAGKAVARVLQPDRVPTGLHGTWVPGPSV